MKKILIITIIDFEKGINQHTHHLVEFLKSKGQPTVLFTKSMPNLNLWERFAYLFIFKTISSYNKKVKLIGVKTTYGPYTRKSIFGDLMTILFLILGFLRCSHEKYDICIAQAPWAGVAGYLLKKFRRVKTLVYEDLDLFPEFTHRRLEKKIISFLEKVAIRKSNSVVSIGKELADLRKQQHNVDIIIVPNGVDFKLFSSAKKVPHPPTLIYVGSLEKWAGVDLPIRAMPKLLKKIPNLRYLILGKGSPAYKKELQKLVEEIGLEKQVHFLDHQPYAEIPKYLQEADIGVATFQPLRLMKYAFTLKVIEYIAAGLPVIATNIGETSKLLSQISAGVLIPFSEDAFTEAVITLYKQPDWTKLSQVARKFASNFDWKELFTREWQAIEHNLTDIR